MGIKEKIEDNFILKEKQIIKGKPWVAMFCSSSAESSSSVWPGNVLGIHSSRWFSQEGPATQIHRGLCLSGVAPHHVRRPAHCKLFALWTFCSLRPFMPLLGVKAKKPRFDQHPRRWVKCWLTNMQTPMEPVYSNSPLADMGGCWNVQCLGFLRKGLCCSCSQLLPL